MAYTDKTKTAKTPAQQPTAPGKLVQTSSLSATLASRQADALEQLETRADDMIREAKADFRRAADALLADKLQEVEDLDFFADWALGISEETEMEALQEGEPIDVSAS